MKEEYIKREDAINIYCKNCGWREGQCDEDEGFWCEERSLLTKLPSADVVEVVRCKDCANYAGEGMYCAWNLITGDMGYCHHGERK